MNKATRATLERLLIDGYAELRRRLTHHLKSSDAASDALQETYLRLQNIEATAEIHSPHAYLFRVALNTGREKIAREVRRLTLDEAEALRHSADDVLNPEVIMKARQDIGLMQRALNEMPARRRAIVIGARLEGISHNELAAKFGLSTRMIEKELKRGLEECSLRLGFEIQSGFGLRGPKPAKIIKQAVEDTSDDWLFK